MNQSMNGKIEDAPNWVMKRKITRVSSSPVTTRLNLVVRVGSPPEILLKMENLRDGMEYFLIFFILTFQKRFRKGMNFVSNE